VYLSLFANPDAPEETMVAMAACHCGEPASAEADLKPLRQFGPPVTDLILPMPYPVINTLSNGGYPRGAFNYWKSAFLSDHWPEMPGGPTASRGRRALSAPCGQADPLVPAGPACRSATPEDGVTAPCARDRFLAMLGSSQRRFRLADEWTRRRYGQQSSDQPDNRPRRPGESDGCLSTPGT
jgi:hypothetical protein